jgi:hypothetical protein
MAKMGPIPRKKFIQRLSRLGFVGPFHGRKHDFMVRPTDERRATMPREDAKSREIGIALQMRILKQIDVSTTEWLSLD